MFSSKVFISSSCIICLNFARCGSCIRADELKCVEVMRFYSTSCEHCTPGTAFNG